MKGLTTATATVRTLAAEERDALGIKALDGEVDHGAFEVILSTPDKDRDGEEVKAEEWQLPLPEHITFDHDHGMSVASTVGSGVPTLEDGQLIVRGTYASTPLAQDVRTLVREGHIRTTSVAFMRKQVTVDGQRVVRRELLNGAFVAVPANPAAVVRSTKALADLAAEPDDDVADEQVSAEDAVDLASKALAGAVRKALAGSFEERQGAVQRAIDRRYRGTSIYAYLLATTATDAVWRAWSSYEDEHAEWRAEYTLDADGRATLSEPTRVRVVEVLTEAADTDSAAGAASSTGTVSDVEAANDGGNGLDGAAAKDGRHTTDTADPVDVTRLTDDALEQVRGDHAPEGDDPVSSDEQAAVEQARALAHLRLTRTRLAALTGHL